MFLSRSLMASWAASAVGSTSGMRTPAGVGRSAARLLVNGTPACSIWAWHSWRPNATVNNTAVRGEGGVLIWDIRETRPCRMTGPVGDAQAFAPFERGLGTHPAGHAHGTRASWSGVRQLLGPCRGGNAPADIHQDAVTIVTAAAVLHQAAQVRVFQVIAHYTACRYRTSNNAQDRVPIIVLTHVAQGPITEGIAGPEQHGTQVALACLGPIGGGQGAAEVHRERCCSQCDGGTGHHTEVVPMAHGEVVIARCDLQQDR